jgi:glucan 1,3-beta-glucosidase
MISLPTDSVISWTTNAINIVRASGMDQWIAFGDGFLGLPNWQGKLQGVKNLVIDAHEYVIFNADQIAFSHQDKLSFACSGWAGQIKQSMDTSTG